MRVGDLYYCEPAPAEPAKKKKKKKKKTTITPGLTQLIPEYEEIEDPWEIIPEKIPKKRKPKPVCGPIITKFYADQIDWFVKQLQKTFIILPGRCQMLMAAVAGPSGRLDFKPNGRGEIPGCPVLCEGTEADKRNVVEKKTGRTRWHERRSLTFCGTCIHHHVPGNMAFGIVGTACGYSRNTLLFIAREDGMSAEDAESVKGGARIAKRMGMVSQHATAGMGPIDKEKLIQNICYEIHKRTTKSGSAMKARPQCRLCDKNYPGHEEAAKIHALVRMSNYLY